MGAARVSAIGRGGLGALPATWTRRDVPHSARCSAPLRPHVAAGRGRRIAVAPAGAGQASRPSGTADAQKSASGPPGRTAAPMMTAGPGADRRVGRGADGDPDHLLRASLGNDDWPAQCPVGHPLMHRRGLGGPPPQRPRSESGCSVTFRHVGNAPKCWSFPAPPSNPRPYYCAAACRFAKVWRSWYLRILPVALRGSAETISSRPGSL